MLVAQRQTISAMALALTLVTALSGNLARMSGQGGVVQAQASPNLVPAAYDNAAAGGIGGYGGPGAATPGTPGAIPNTGYNTAGPAPPTNPARPSSWPGGVDDPGRVQMDMPQASRQTRPSAAPPVVTKSPLEYPLEPAAILARVGSEVVQVSEILPSVHQMLDVHLEKIKDEFAKAPQEVQDSQREKWERELIDTLLVDIIKIKLLYSEVRSKVPAEALKKNEERIRREFNEVELKRLLKLYKVVNVVDLDAKLRQQGGSLEAQRSVFIEKYMAVTWLRQQVGDQKEPTHDQMAAYYHDHAKEWERPARARWEQLTARFDKFPSKEAARAELARWGNEVFRGASFPDIARKYSHGVSAEEGGLHDWTTQGSLRSEILDQALFGLPVGSLSQIIEDEDGYHIVRIVEREDQHRIPFGEVQPDIKKKLLEGEQNDAMNAYIAKLREHTPVTNYLVEREQAMANRPSGPTR